VPHESPYLYQTDQKISRPINEGGPLNRTANERNESKRPVSHEQKKYILQNIYPALPDLFPVQLHFPISSHKRSLLRIFLRENKTHHDG